MRTVIGLYDDIDQAREAVEDLVDAGINRTNVSLVARDVDETYAPYFEERDIETTDNVEVAAAEGAIAGGVVGGLAGVLLGLGLFAIPGLGPVLAAGPLIAGLVGAGAGAATGGLLGALIEAGIPDTEAEYYAEGVRRGGTLVTVHAQNDEVDDVVDIMNEHDPVDVEERAVTWRETGWTGYDANAFTLAEEEGYGHDEDYSYVDYEPTYRTHYRHHYAPRGYTYDIYEPAYRYGYSLAVDDRYYDYEWVDLEPEAQQHWEREHEGAWDQFKEAVRHGWEEVKDTFDLDEDDEYEDYDEYDDDTLT